jgi:cyanobactin maturation PatA/PatG family protease
MTALADMTDSIPAAVPGLQELWSETTGDSRICIAILDGPVDLAHPCFFGAPLAEVETLVLNAAGDDLASEHGTHVASVIFGQHGGPVAGIAPGCRGLILPIYTPGQNALLACSQLDLARAINQAVVEGAHIINISGGELTPTGDPDPLLAQAIRTCSESGVLIVAAAGNDGCACLHVPAAVPSVLAVGAMDKTGSVLDFSNWGPAYQEQGILALGQDIKGAVPGGGTARKTGTSFATPVVTGIAALLMSAQLRRGEKRDGAKVRAAILESADSGDLRAEKDRQRMLAGRLNVTAARAMLAAGAAAVIAAEPHDFLKQRTQKEKDMSDQLEPVGGNQNPGNAASAGPAEGTADRAVATEYPDRANPPDSPLFAAVGTGGAAARSAAAVMPSSVEAAECTSCAAGDSATPPMAYVLGQIGYDFGTESRRDQFLQLTGRNVHDPGQFLAYLQQDPASAASVIWTLSMDATVVYAITPFGPYANVAYERLREALAAQLAGNVERVSVPGYVKGSAHLLNGQQVPVLYPDVRGLYSWSTSALVQEVVGKAPKGEKVDEHDKRAKGIQNFLERIYYEIRNLGITPQDRAMNYAATNAFQLDFIYRDAVTGSLKLDGIEVERSPICRPGSDCWDVKLVFFDRAHRLERARHIYRFTVDVSEVIPVTVGKVRDWDVY